MRKTILACGWILACGSALGAGWQIRSARSLGMGGAGVALADDAGANYWNPAALGTYNKGWSGTVDVVAKAGFLGDSFQTMDSILQSIEDASSVYDLDAISARIDAGTATEQDIQDLLKTILVDFAGFYDKEFGVFADAGGSASYAQHLLGGKLACNVGYTGYGETGAVVDILSMALQVGSDALNSFIDVFEAVEDGGIPLGSDPSLWPGRGLGVDEQAFADALSDIMDDDPTIDAAAADKIAEELVYQSAAAGAGVLDPEVQDMLTRIVNATISGDTEFVENGTEMRFEALTVQETRIAYGYPILGKLLSAGITLNIMSGTTYKAEIGYDDVTLIESFEDVVDMMFSDDTMRDSVRLGVDVGLLCSPVKMLSVGIVGHNVLPVEFDQADGGTFTLRPQWRMGAAVRPMKDLVIAADMDLAKLPSEAIKDYETQTYAAGIEYYAVPKVLAFRTGIAGDFLNQQEDLMWSFGLGVRLGRILRLDVGLTAEGDLSGIEDAFVAPEDIADISLPRSVSAAVSFALNVSF